MKKVKKGFTLLEIIAVISIMVIIVSFSLGILRESIRIINYQQVCNEEEKILSFFNYSKNYCYTNNESGYIIFNEDEGIILFTKLDNKVIDKIKLDKEVKLKIENSNTKIRSITNMGYITQGITIKLSNKYEKSKIIKIDVGTDIIYES